MGHVILGLLLIRPMSLYDLLRAFEAGVSLFYSASSGSLKRALDVLLANGHAEVESVETSGRGRKVYRVTDSGRVEFRAWMRSELTGGDAETAALSRLFFLGLLDQADRGEVKRRIEARAEAELARLEAVERQLADADIPDGLEDVAAYQRATLAYGLASARFSREWFAGLGSTNAPDRAADFPQ